MSNTSGTVPTGWMALLTGVNAIRTLALEPVPTDSNWRVLGPVCIAMTAVGFAAWQTARARPAVETKEASSAA